MHIHVVPGNQAITQSNYEIMAFAQEEPVTMQTSYNTLYREIQQYNDKVDNHIQRAALGSVN